VTLPRNETHAPAEPSAEDRARACTPAARLPSFGAPRRRGALGPFLLMLVVGLGMLAAALATNLGRLRSFVMGAGAATTLCVAAILTNRALGRRARKAGGK
jgi:hypothetical protein